MASDKLNLTIIADDLTIAGFEKTLAKWQAHHNRNVRAFLDSCHERNLKLNKKARLRQQEIVFIGHLLTP